MWTVWNTRGIRSNNIPVTHKTSNLNAENFYPNLCFPFLSNVYVCKENHFHEIMVAAAHVYIMVTKYKTSEQASTETKKKLR